MKKDTENLNMYRKKKKNIKAKSMFFLVVGFIMVFVYFYTF